jgi:hypothetical protein
MQIFAGTGLCSRKGEDPAIRKYLSEFGDCVEYFGSKEIIFRNYTH